MSHEFEDEMELGLDASLEDVWDAISTGPGMDAWFMGRTTVSPDQSSIRADMGGFVQEFQVTEWRFQDRLAYRTPLAEDGSFLALEWLLEAREGGTTWLRSVASGFIGADDWDDQYDALREGGRRYLANLGGALAYFRGRGATPINAGWPARGSAQEIRSVFARALGLDGDLREGQRVRLEPSDVPAAQGVIDILTPAALGVRTDDALLRFFRGAAGMAIVEHHVFSGPIDHDEVQQKWQSWLTRLFA